SAPGLNLVRGLATFGSRYARSQAAVLGLALTLLMLSIAFFANIIAPYSPHKAAGPSLQAPSAAYPMGTDDLGRDVFTDVVYGARTSLTVGALVAGIAALIGVLVGGVSGYFGNRVDDGLMRITEVFQVVPRFFLAVIVIALFGAGLRNVIFVLGLTSWTMIARILRAEVLSLRERDFVVAAQATGARHRTIILRHVLPNALPSLVVTVSLLVGHAILVEASLSFLGLGDPNTISWGYMLNNAQPFMRTAWWVALFPGLAITLTVLGLNLTGDGLNNAWNPKL
ncbi:MAG: ABC transporter permease, partial [Anaerolineae bacterium]